METTTINTTTTIRVARLASYLTMVAALALLNCTILQAETPESEIRLESWMLDYNTTVDVEDQDVAVEAWMTTDSEFMAEAEVEVESWMTDNSEFAAESEVNVENWMNSSPLDLVSQNDRAFERWMIHCCDNTGSVLVN